MVVAALVWGPGPAESARQLSPDWAPEPPAIEQDRLPTGLRVVYLEDGVRPPVAAGIASGDRRTHIAFGYALDPPRTASERDLHAAAAAWLLKSVPARTIELVAHLGGGEFERVEEADLVGVRVQVPERLAGTVIEHAARFLDQTLERGDLLDYVLEVGWDPSRARNPDATDRAIGEVVSTLQGGEGVIDVAMREPVVRPDPALVEAYFRSRFATARGWVILSRPPTAEDLGQLAGVRVRSSDTPPRPIGEMAGVPQSSLVLPSQSRGGLVIGSRIAGVYFEEWFNTLVVDRAMRARLDPAVSSDFVPARDHTVHLLTMPVAFPDYPDNQVSAIMAEIARLANSLPPPMALHDAKQDALDYLGRRPVLEWFAAHDLWRPLEDGWARIWNLTEDQFWSSSAAFLREPRVTATWAPAFDVPSVIVEDLSVRPAEEATPTELRMIPGTVEVPLLGDLPSPDSDPVRVERLGSGVTLAQGEPAIFIGGRVSLDLSPGIPQSGPNGTLWTFEDVPEEAVLERLRGIRPDRLLFFAPSGAHESLRELFEEWTSGAMDATDSSGVGTVATTDLPALVILKVWLDRKIIEAGWSGEVDVRISATEGSRIFVDSDSNREDEVRRWLASAAGEFEGDRGEQEFRELRSAAGTYFERVRGDLEVLLWQRAPDGEIPPPETVSLSRFRNVLRVYF